MFRRLLILSAFLTPLASLHAQRSETTTANDDKGPFVGVLFASVSEALYDQLPQLPHSGGSSACKMMRMPDCLWHSN